ncbi:MAG: hypothetical protein IJ057_10840 [Bacteroidales bacterium]|nr:hypothetical protein [Bacteroidales bacterium]
MDFTLEKYRQLLHGLRDAGYGFVTFQAYCEGLSDFDGKFVILRHDVDLKAEHSLAVAKTENELGAKASYYFRVVPQSDKPEIIKAIAGLEHEIGYHYEDMTLCEGNAEKAIRHFEQKLRYFRQFYPVKTICMHGAPRSKYDGRDLWKHYDYHDFGIVGEPYFDVDFSKVLYLTDTGRRWDGFNVSVRDKIPVYQDEWIKKGLVFHSTDDIIDAIGTSRFPRQLMMTTHPQRWTDDRAEWMKERLLQSAKNMVKAALVRRK